MNFEFSNPLWLLLLLPSAAWIWWMASTSGVHMGLWRRTVALYLRLGVLIALVFALAGIRWVHLVEGMNLVFVLDVSESIPARQQEAAREFIQRTVRDKPVDDQAGLVVFGSRASLESTVQTTLDVSRIAAVVPGEHSDLGSALRLANAALPETGQRRLVLVSDGNENLGDALAAAISSRTLQTVIDVVPLGARHASDVSITRLQMPSLSKLNQPFEAKVFIDADEAGPAMVRLFRNDMPLGGEKVHLHAGHNALTFPQTLIEPGFYSYDVRVEASNDSVPQNNRASSFTQVKGNPRILLVSSAPQADAPLVAALQSPETTLIQIGPPQFPSTLAETESYEAIVLSNVSAIDLSRDQQLLLATAVHDFGVGLVCIGGDNTYAAGAYKGTPLDEILPVDSDLSSRKILPSGALVLVIDHSGSMSGEKLNMAKQASSAAASLLTPVDYVGVIAFDDQNSEVVPMQHPRDKRPILEGIEGITVGGGTAMYPALVRAQEMLMGVQASIKHCVVLTDGMSSGGDFEGISTSMAANHITFSTVGLGTDCDVPLMQKMAALGRGRFYHVPWAIQLPQIFIKETSVILKTAIDEAPFVPQLATATEMIRGLGSDFPSLTGHVATTPKPRAELALVTENGDPLLAHWQYGLGRTVAFTSDAQTRWAQSWIAWSQYRQFWQQTVHWSLRRLDDANLRAQVALEQGDGRVSVEALDAQGNFRNFLQLQAHISSPKGQHLRTTFRQTGPGHYEAQFPAQETGMYLLNLLELEGSKVIATQIVGASLNYSPEFATKDINTGLLRQIAEITGGKMIDLQRTAGNPFFDDRHKTHQSHDLWEILLRIAVVLFVVDVGVRRINPDPEEWRKKVHLVWALLPFRRRARQPMQELQPMLSALRTRRDEARAHVIDTSITIIENPSEATDRRAPNQQNSPLPHEISDQDTSSRLLEAKRRLQRKRE